MNWRDAACPSLMFIARGSNPRRATDPKLTPSAASRANRWHSWRNAFQQLGVGKPQHPLSTSQLGTDVEPDKPEDDEHEQQIPFVFQARERHRAQQRQGHIRKSFPRLSF
jgi:hypothetical protein